MHQNILFDKGDIDMEQEWQRGDYVISTDKTRLDLEVIHHFLTTSYWAKDISLEKMKRALENSLVFGIYRADQQVGFARLVTDYATFAYLDDVFILEPFRGQGLSIWLLDVIQAHPDVQGLRRWLLLTADAQGLYQKVGFTAPQRPERFMEIVVPDIYTREKKALQGDIL
jgi:N-acetylglutamate synthase-like GNAT family acetyltransferase